MDAHLGWGIALVEPLRVFWGVGKKDLLLAETGVQELTELKQKKQIKNQNKQKTRGPWVTSLTWFSAQVS